jgi:hypothetical protein
MPPATEVKGYTDVISSSLTQFQFICRSCGSSTYAISAEHETFCNFCEGYVDLEGMDSVHAEAEKNLMGMSAAVHSGQWLSGVPYADALAATNDPFFLYGAAHFYKFFSDFTYHDMNYEMPGFMYSNAEKRSDEPLRNKYNAMALISKSKGHLFKALKVISSMPPEARLTYLKFMCNVRLKRHSRAAVVLEDLKAFDNDALYKYANMVLSAESVTGKSALMAPDIRSAAGSANFFYYVARYFAKKGRLADSTTVLDKLTQKVYMPMAVFYKMKVTDVNNALDF